MDNALALAIEALSWVELKALAKSRKITIGCHGLTHQRCNRLDYGELTRELVHSKEILETELGRRIDLFAYPHGLYNGICRRVLKEAGYKAAFTGRPGLVEYASNPYGLKRTEINRYDCSGSGFRKKINGSYDWLAVKSILDR